MSHSPRHAPVNVFIAKEHRDGKAWARIEIIDEGSGIPDAMLPHVFDRFFSGRDEHGGTGLGFYIAKPIAIAHGGDVTADRAAGTGARFVITLPALASDAA
ncbi:MAG: sensor histidine kinase [Pseudomonadota bacterium]|nr:sensor histidine kinase [Pseudomonadota bacterium]